MECTCILGVSNHHHRHHHNCRIHVLSLHHLSKPFSQTSHLHLYLFTFVNDNSARSSSILCELLATEAAQLNHLAPEAIGRIDKRSFVCINRRSLPDEIRFAGLDKFGLVNEFPRDKSDGCYKRREIVSKACFVSCT